jgi:RNAse (barnase) inhibitor barstar
MEFLKQKLFSICLLLNDQKVLESAYLQIQPCGENYHLLFEDVSTCHCEPIPEGSDLQVIVNAQGKAIYLFGFSSIEGEIAFECAEGRCEGSFFCTLEVENAQQVLEILHGWAIGDGQYEDWRERGDQFCEAWLSASLKWAGGIRKSYEPQSSIIVDGGAISTKNELYCALGEAFFGKKGYLGSNLDALEDCLENLSAPNSKPTVLFKDFEQMCKAIDNVEYLQAKGKSYSQVLLDIFRRNFYEITLT